MRRYWRNRTRLPASCHLYRAVVDQPVRFGFVLAKPTFSEKYRMPLSLYFGNAWGACACGKPPVGTAIQTQPKALQIRGFFGKSFWSRITQTIVKAPEARTNRTSRRTLKQQGPDHRTSDPQPGALDWGRGDFPGHLQACTKRNQLYASPELTAPSLRRG